MLWKNRLRQGWTVGIMSLALLTCVRPAFAAGEHYVFAHYMVCYATYGENLEGYKKEILEAKSAGIDGFALNVGAWNGPDTYYKRRVELMYQAAESLNVDFKLFFSVDLNITNDILQMITAYAYRTNSFYYQGKLVISSFGAGSFLSANVIQPLNNMGIRTFFVPYSWPSGWDWNNLNTSANAVLADENLYNIDGFFSFACGDTDGVNYLNAVYSQAAKTAGKLFMAGCNPTYWGNSQKSTGRCYFETQGGNGIDRQWSWILTNQPDWVEIVTWNDFNESTYISPVDDPAKYEGCGLDTPRRNSHAGYLELTKRYISWYKTGQAPAITQDSLCFFYRTHSINAIASDVTDVPVTASIGPMQDALYATVLLTAPANLETISGSTRTTNSLVTGINQVQIPFNAGSQKFTLRRNGLQILTVQGPDIQNQVTNYDYFTTSGFVYRPGHVPPSNLSAAGN